MNIFVIGSGNWGTTLARLFSDKNKVYLWTIDQKEANKLNSTRVNEDFLAGFEIPKKITIEAKFSRKINRDDIAVIAIPSRKIEELMEEFKQHGVKKCIMVNASKGVKHSNLKTISEIVLDKLPLIRFATLSGPTIAREVAAGLPAKAVLASKDIELLFLLQDVLENPVLQFEFSRDVFGIELASSLKGIIAIAVGIADGLNFQANIFGLIMTYGLREFTTVMTFLGVSPNTAYGIAGMGDLITTCISENSRNRKFGKYLAQGYSRDAALQKVGMEVEGVSMAKTIKKLAKFNLTIPLISCITRIIYEDVEDIKKELMTTLNSISN